jgi:hypothetical protein
MEFETGQVFLIEVKAGQTYRSDHTRAIRELAERLGSRFLGGAVLSTAPDSMVLGRSIIGLPIAAVWEEH